MKVVPPLKPPRDAGHCGFTLIELLISMAILGLVLVLVAQLINSASQVTTTGNKRSDADSQARQILDRMSLDFARMVKRPDVDFLYLSATNAINTTGNDQIAFFSESTGYYPSATGTNANQKSDVSLVGYMITTNTSTTPNQPQLVRLSKGLVWNGVSTTSSTTMIFGTSSNQGSVIQANWPDIANGTDTNYQTLSSEVYRMEFCFLNMTRTGGSTTYSYSLTPAPNVENIAAIIVAIAILDTTSRKIVTNFSSMAGALLDLTTGNLSKNPPVLMSNMWNNTINSPTFASTSGIPQAAASQIRVYQRFIYLNQYNQQ